MKVSAIMMFLLMTIAVIAVVVKKGEAIKWLLIPWRSIWWWLPMIVAIIGYNTGWF